MSIATWDTPEGRVRDSNDRTGRLTDPGSEIPEMTGSMEKELEEMIDADSDAAHTPSAPTPRSSTSRPFQIFKVLRSFQICQLSQCSNLSVFKLSGMFKISRCSNLRNFPKFSQCSNFQRLHSWKSLQNAQGRH